MAIALTEEIPKHQTFINSGAMLMYFFCDSTHEKQRTATGILRGMLYQLQKSHPDILNYLEERVSGREEKAFGSFDTLWSIFMHIINDESTGHKYCVIDALDECEDHSQLLT